MDARLYQAGYLAIPLQHNEGHTLNPQPNFLVIENIYGTTKAELPTLGGVVVANSTYKLVYREILEASKELGRNEEMREIVYENTSQFIPITLVPALSDYEYLSQAVEQVNTMLALFQFRGMLAGFQLIIDEEVINEILTPITTTINITTTLQQ